MINILGYTINKLLNYLTFKTNSDNIVIKTNLGHWHLVVFFFRKIILVKTKYKTHNSKLFIIIKIFKLSAIT